LKEKLEESIADNFQKYYKKEKIYLDENRRWLFTIHDLKIKRITYNEVLFIDFEFKITNMSISGSSKAGSNDSSYLSSFRLELHKDFLTKDNLIYRFGEVERNEKDYTGSGLNSIRYSPIFFLSGIEDQGAVGIRIPSETNQQLEKFVNGIKGEADSVDHRFLRMLYLSMVTITTLGYGDIVPLTNIARFLIGIEATVGIVIMGWFVNSLLSKN